MTLQRNGDKALVTNQQQMDDLGYKYKNIANGYLRNTNQLVRVDDNVVSGNYTEDIDDQSGENYKYDEIGNLKSDDQEQIQEIKWNVYGKVQAVIRTTGSTKPDLEFVYDASGNRIAKIVKPAVTKADEATWTVTYYMRDAQGNVLSTYEKTPLAFKLEEQYLYGSSRIGLLNRGIDPTVNPSSATLQYYARSLSRKTFELSNHLGNVLTTVSDRKIGIPDLNNPTQIAYYTAVVLSSSDYYAFGASMPGRSYSSNSYRYGFNGKEKDGEFNDNYDFGARMFDVRLGRWLAIDPLFKNYVSFSPYSGMVNSPIFLIDKNGKVLTDANGNIIYEVDESKPSHSYTQGSYSVIVRNVFVYSNSGDPISVQQYLVVNTTNNTIADNKVVTTSYNCHGHSSLKDEFRVNSSKSESNKLLLDKGGFDKESDLNGVVSKDFSAIKAGDIVVLFNKDGVAIHSFKYLGGGKVSSKNGELKINEFVDEKNTPYLKLDATIKDVKDLYAMVEKQTNGGTVTAGYFTPVPDKVVSTDSQVEVTDTEFITSTYSAPKNGTVERKTSRVRSFISNLGIGRQTKDNTKTPEAVKIK